MHNFGVNELFEKGFKIDQKEFFEEAQTNMRNAIEMHNFAVNELLEKGFRDKDESKTLKHVR